ncbi:MAG: carboxylesterase/lipase family protein [Janthinobacterium lividum]
MRFNRLVGGCLLVQPFFLCASQAQQVRHVQQQTTDGAVEGVVSADDKVRTFKGIPYAAPPVGTLRWRAPEPVVAWTAVRQAVEYPQRCMQGPPPPGMTFGDSGPSEDCLYLSLWMPAHPDVAKLPVMLWINGEQFAAGSTSEPRQDAGNLSKKGVLVVSFNYRLGIFGFLAHPELAKESPSHASGNYGFLDQIAALRWLKKNIASFGGDPDNITIFGAGSGSISVSALMASPLARGLFQHAIGQGGACLSEDNSFRSRADAERISLGFEKAALGSTSVEVLRASSAEALLDAALKQPAGTFSPDIDGEFLPNSCAEIYRSGNQSHVPLLAGWDKNQSANSAMESARVWVDLQSKTGTSVVYSYEFDQSLPHAENSRQAYPALRDLPEIEFVFRVLSSKQLPWKPEDATYRRRSLPIGLISRRQAIPTALACRSGRVTRARPKLTPSISECLSSTEESSAFMSDG